MLSSTFDVPSAQNTMSYSGTHLLQEVLSDTQPHPHKQHQATPLGSHSSLCLHIPALSIHLARLSLSLVALGLSRGEVWERHLVTTESPASPSTGPGAGQGLGVFLEQWTGKGQSRFCQAPQHRAARVFQPWLPAGRSLAFPPLHAAFRLPASSSLTHTLILDLPLPPPAGKY